MRMKNNKGGMPLSSAQTLQRNVCLWSQAVKNYAEGNTVSMLIPYVLDEDGLPVLDPSNDNLPALLDGYKRVATNEKRPRKKKVDLLMPANTKIEVTDPALVERYWRPWSGGSARTTRHASAMQQLIKAMNSAASMRASGSRSGFSADMKAALRDWPKDYAPSDRVPFETGAERRKYMDALKVAMRACPARALVGKHVRANRNRTRRAKYTQKNAASIAVRRAVPDEAPNWGEGWMRDSPPPSADEFEGFTDADIDAMAAGLLPKGIGATPQDQAQFWPEPLAQGSPGPGGSSPGPGGSDTGLGGSNLSLEALLATGPAPLADANDDLYWMLSRWQGKT